MVGKYTEFLFILMLKYKCKIFGYFNLGLVGVKLKTTVVKSGGECHQCEFHSRMLCIILNAKFKNLKCFKH